MTQILLDKHTAKINLTLLLADFLLFKWEDFVENLHAHGGVVIVASSPRIFWKSHLLTQRFSKWGP